MVFLDEIRVSTCLCLQPPRAYTHSLIRAHKPSNLLLPLLLPGPKTPLPILGGAGRAPAPSPACCVAVSNTGALASVLPSVKWA